MIWLSKILEITYNLRFLQNAKIFTVMFSSIQNVEFIVLIRVF